MSPCLACLPLTPQVWAVSLAASASVTPPTAEQNFSGLRSLQGLRCALPGLAFPAPARNRCSTNLVKPEDEQEVSPLAKGIGGICGKVQDGAGVVQRRQQQLAEAGGGGWLGNKGCGQGRDSK